ncbi:MAG: hypothetical protein K6T85_07010 [Gorillibacterium sp.]|nr:hypothetical protein [Gorillibacterium sp.]
MTIYRLAIEGVGIKDPQYIHAISIEVVNLGEHKFDVLVQGFQEGTKSAEILNHVPGSSASHTEKLSLPIIPTDGLPFQLQITTNRNTLESAYFFIYALENNQTVGIMTNEHMTIDA